MTFLTPIVVVDLHSVTMLARTLPPRALVAECEEAWEVHARAKTVFEAQVSAASRIFIEIHKQYVRALRLLLHCAHSFC